MALFLVASNLRWRPAAILENFECPRICATGDPIHVMLGSRVGFLVSADRMALFPVKSNPCWQQAAILDNFEWLYLRNGSFDPLV